MQPDERPHKKAKPSTEDDSRCDVDIDALHKIDELRRKLAKMEHRIMVPRDGSGGVVSTVHAQQPSEASTSDQKSFTVFVLDTQSRLFAAGKLFCNQTSSGHPTCSNHMLLAVSCIEVSCLYMKSLIRHLPAWRHKSA